MSAVTSGNSILICGLPGSGKTTFLGALSYLMTAREIETQLKHGGLPSERTFLNKLADRWCQCEPMERTLHGEEETISLNFQSEEEAIEVNFPDLAGETWQKVWEHHQCSEKLAGLANNSSGIVLFIHSNEIRSPISVVDAERIASAIRESEPQGVQGEEDSQAPELWSSKDHPPTQAILVALLQQLSTQPMGNKKKRVAIVLSAWDRIEGYGPETFVKEKLPLLYQYLNSGFDYMEWSAYGVSAQGGDLPRNDEEQEERLIQEKQRLLEIDIQSRRIKVFSQGNISNDLTAIIDWVMN